MSVLASEYHTMLSAITTNWSLLTAIDIADTMEGVAPNVLYTRGDDFNATVHLDTGATITMDVYDSVLSWSVQAEEGATAVGGSLELTPDMDAPVPFILAGLTA